MGEWVPVGFGYGPPPSPTPHLRVQLDVVFEAADAFREHKALRKAIRKLKVERLQEYGQFAFRPACHRWLGAGSVGTNDKTRRQ